jgi:hypothetical protein
LSQRNGSDGGVASSAGEGVIVVKVSDSTSTTAGMSKVYLDVLDQAVSSLSFGQFLLGSDDHRTLCDAP